MKLASGPPKTIQNLAHLPLKVKLLSLSESGISSIFIGSSPNIFTYPPNGISDQQYSVSPFLNFKSLGPNPKEKTSTRTPKSLAKKKWPSSWKNTRGNKNRIKIKIFSINRNLSSFMIGSIVPKLNRRVSKRISYQLDHTIHHVRVSSLNCL